MAGKSDHKHQVGAVIVNKNRIIGLGFNKATKTHPRSPHPFKTIHAELDSILGIPKEHLRGSEIYVYREYVGGKPAMARPCKYCWALLQEVGIKTVYYTDNGEYKQEIISENKP